MKRLAWVLAIALLAGGCSRDGAEPRVDAAEPEAIAQEYAGDGGREKLSRRVAEPSFKGLAIPDWPDGWREIDRGRFAGDDAPVVWFKLEATSETPEAAARAAAAAITQIAGTVRIDDVVVESTGSQAVAQVRASRLTAVVEASRERESIFVKVLMEPAPGFGR